MIYLLEDDDSIRKLVMYTLNSQGFEVMGFEKPSAFWQQLEEETPELLLLDIMLPEEDGLAVLQKLRQRATTANLPVIMMTAKTSEYDRVIGLDSGADDYICKPFGMLELVSRVRAVLRRKPTAEPTEEFVCGDLHVDPARHAVHIGAEEVQLTRKEFDLLCLLFTNRGLVMSRDQLLTRIWGYDFEGGSRTVDVHIRNLRQKLGEAGNCIETVRGVGYKIGENK